MKFSICLECNTPLETFIQQIRQIEQHGFHGLWLTDLGLNAADVFAYMTVAVTHAGRLKVGAAVHPTQLRHPAVTLNSLVTLDQMSPARIMLGIGTGDPIFLIPIGRRALKLESMRELIGLSRALMDGDSVNSETPDLIMKEVRLFRAPDQPLPIYIAATGPKMLALSGEIADGVLAHVGAARETLELALESCARGGEVRTLKSGIDFSPYLYLSLATHKADALANCAKGAQTIVRRAPYLARAVGCSEEQIQELAKGHTDIGNIVTEQVIDKLTLGGTVKDCATKLEIIAGLGIEHVTLYPRGNKISQAIDTFARELLPQFN